MDSLSLYNDVWGCREEIHLGHSLLNHIESLLITATAGITVDASPRPATRSTASGPAATGTTAAATAATAVATTATAVSKGMRNHWRRYRGHQQRSHQGNVNDQSEHFCLPAL
jgi:hypothetical protein